MFYTYGIEIAWLDIGRYVRSVNLMACQAMSGPRVVATVMRWFLFAGGGVPRMFDRGEGGVPHELAEVSTLVIMALGIEHQTSPKGI
jgi:hypothetical protein